jgi:hypothetical protein
MPLKENYYQAQLNLNLSPYYKVVGIGDVVPWVWDQVSIRKEDYDHNDAHIEGTEDSECRGITEGSDCASQRYRVHESKLKRRFIDQSFTLKLLTV